MRPLPHNCHFVVFIFIFRLHFFLKSILTAPLSQKRFIKFPSTVCNQFARQIDSLLAYSFYNIASHITLLRHFTFPIFLLHAQDALLFQSSSATGAHSAAYSRHFAHRCSTLSGDCRSVDLAPVSFTIRSNISGFSSIGHGRR